MSGLISLIYARRNLDGQLLDSIDEVLASLSEPIQRTRKGRTWACRIAGRPIEVRIEVTSEVLWDCEDDLLELGLLPDDAPARVVLVADCSTDEDRQIVGSLASQISKIVNGIVIASGW